MGSAAPATQRESSPVVEHREIVGDSAAAAPAPAMEPTPQPDAAESANSLSASADDVGRVQNAALEALRDNNQRILVSMLSEGEWSIQGNEVVIKIAESQTIIDMSMSNDARRIAIAAASGVLGRAVKLKLIPGATVAPQEKKNGVPKFAPGPGGRGRAEQDPLVKRMQEKFGAEIRTVIDYREKR